MAKASKSSSPRVVPLHDRVLIKEVDRADTKTASGIIIPEAATPERDTKKGVVVSVGPGKFVDGKREPISVKVGQTVLYSWGDQVVISGQKYTLVHDGDILAVIG